MSNDLHLKYKFTDRGGAKVYEKYDSEDRIALLHPMGEVRLSGTTVDNSGYDACAVHLKTEGHGTG